MKFRALNFDYHADATLQWADGKKRCVDCNESLMILRAGCYEKKEPPPSKQSQNPPNDSAEPPPDAPMDVANDIRILLATAPAQPTSGAGTAEISLLVDSTMTESVDSDNNMADTAGTIPMDIDEETFEVMEEEKPNNNNNRNSGSDEPSKVPHKALKKKYQPRLLTAAELQLILLRMHRVAHTPRLANEPWHDDVRQHYPCGPFWHEPREFLPPATTSAQDILDLFRHCKSSLSTRASSQEMQRITRGLGPQLRLVGNKAAVPAANDGSFSLLGMLRGGAGSFGLRRVVQASCKAQLAVERCAIVPYTGPRTTTQAAAQFQPQQLMWAVQLALAALEQSRAASATTTTAIIPSVNGVNGAGADAKDDERDNPINDRKGGGFAKYLQNQKKRLRDTSPDRSQWRTNSPTVSFADLVKRNKSDEPDDKQEVRAPPLCVATPTSPGKNKPQPPFDDRGADPTDAESMGKKHGANEHQDEAKQSPAKKQKKKRNERSAEEKTARKKERKARKKEERREDKKRKRSKAAAAALEKSTEEAFKRPKNREHPAAEQSSKRPVVLPRSVVGSVNSKSALSRRVSVEQSRNVLEQARSVLNNKHHENRPAFSQMKLQRSTVARNTAKPSQNHFQEQHPGQRAAANTATDYPSSQQWNVPASASNHANNQLHQQSRAAPPSHPQARSGMHGFQAAHPANLSLSGVHGRTPGPAGSATARQAVGGHNGSASSSGQPTHFQGSNGSAAQTSQPTQFHSSQQNSKRESNQISGETTYQAKPPATHGQPGPSVLPPLSLLCSETFLESWPGVVAALASGRWAKDPAESKEATEIPFSNPAHGQKINLVDTPLVDACGVAIEGPDRCALLVFSVSSLEAVSDAKQIVLEVAELAAISRYTTLYIFLSYNDTTITSSIAKHLVHLQCAAVPSKGLTETKVSIKTASSDKLSTAIAQTIFRHPTTHPPGGPALAESTIEGASDSQLQERARFLLALLPVLSATGAIQCLLLAKQLLPNGSPTFRLVSTTENKRKSSQINHWSVTRTPHPCLLSTQKLFQNQRLRQRIMLAASPETGSAVHPKSMVQLSRVLRASTST